MSDLAEILDTAERLEREATSGPWANEGGIVFADEKCVGSVSVRPDGAVAHVADADFIAFARTALPRLVAVARVAERMRATYGKLASLHSVTSGVPTFAVDEYGEVVETGRTPDVDNPDCEHCRVLRAFDAVASGGEEKPNE